MSKKHLLKMFTLTLVAIALPCAVLALDYSGRQDRLGFLQALFTRSEDRFDKI
jgi:hypothetical protein